MKHNKSEYSFEELLKQSFLESEDNNINQKVIEMNAQYIFNQPATGINLTQDKLNDLLSRHQISSKAFGLKRFLQFLLPALVLITSIYLINKNTSPKPKKSFVPPIVRVDEKDSTEVTETEPITTNEFDAKTPIKTVSKNVKNKSQKELQPKKKEHYGSSWTLPAPVMPRIKMSYPDLYEAPAPKFEMKASPENYILKGAGSYIISTRNSEFDLKKADNWINFYEGEPFSEGMDNFVYVNNAKNYNKRIFAHVHGRKYGELVKNKKTIHLPNQLIFYLDDYKLNPSKKIEINKLSKKQKELLSNPFYFSKYEVTVKEYKDFMAWVLESNGYEKQPFVLDTVANVRIPQYTLMPYNENIAKRRYYYVKWNIDKNKAYKYTFFNPSKDVINALKGNSLGIAPLDSIYQKNNNQFGLYYEINPFYGSNARNTYEERQNFPVVGVSYYQALAFLDWKTHYHQEQLNNSGVNYTIEYELPNMIERELAIDKELEDTKIWLTDLYLSTYEESNLDKLNGGSKCMCCNEDQLHKVKLNRRNKNLPKYAIENGITWLDGNASEWMSDSYQKNWKYAFNTHKKMMTPSEVNKISSLIEDYYNKSNDTLGRLVMGGNYLDYRKGPNNKDTEEGFNQQSTCLKKFVNPHKQYSTVGFRYIIKVKDDNEDKKARLLEYIGSYDYDKYKDFPEKYIKDFKHFDDGKYILDKELTNGMWRSFLMDLLQNNRMDDVEKCLPKSENWNQYNCDYSFYFRDLRFDDLPVVNISYEASNIFNQWMTNKFNAYPLRKYSKVEFLLPTEDEWEKAAMGESASANQYPWFDVGVRDDKKNYLANFVNSPYENHMFTYPLDKDYDPKRNANNLSVILKRNGTPDSLRLFYYEDYLLGKSTYQKFIEEYEKDWIPKESFKIYHTEEQLKSLRKNKIIFEKEHLLSIGGLFPPNRTGLIGKHKKDGLYDMVGNVAEMIKNPKKTKGGSWNTFANLSTVHRSEPWNSKASPMVGLRPMMKVLHKGFDHNIDVKPMKTPPGVILFNPNYGVDINEISNIDYLEYLYYTMKMYGKESNEYLTILPDTTVWDYSNPVADSLTNSQNKVISETSYCISPKNESLQNDYLRHPAYKRDPLVGISYEQAVSYCQWRSDRVNELYAIFHAKNPNASTVPKKVTYRLPTPKEWEQFGKQDSIYDGKIYQKLKINIKTKNQELFFTHPVQSTEPTKIGIYGLHDNVSEMTSEKGIAKGEHWAQKYLKTKGKSLKYSQPKSWIGFRCVVDVEY